MNIFGFKLGKEVERRTETSIVPPTNDDGSEDTVALGPSQGLFVTALNLEGGANSKSESEFIRRYRETANHADVDMAIEDIVNEAIANLDEDPPLQLDLKGLDVSPSLKKRIEQEFDTLLRLMKFNYNAQDFFRRWYIDGRIYFHKVIDTANPSSGIKDIRYIDPRKLKKVRTIEKEKDPKNGVEIVKRVQEYYLYNPSGFTASPTGAMVPTMRTQGAKIEKDSIAFAGSGLADRETGQILSYLHVAIKPANQLRMMENALVIYRLARAPERRAFYVDTGNLPKNKAEQYLKDQMARFRNKLVYDAETGEMRDDKKFMSMLEDFWLPRQGGSRGTEIQTLEGGQNLGEITDVEYFQKKLYQSLRVPVSRIESAGGLNFGRAAEISRDELKFVKFINKLRRRFSLLFLDLLRTQLVLKNIISLQDWTLLEEKIKFKFAQDVYHAETKNQEIFRSRIELAQLAADMEGRFITREYIQKQILRLTDEEIAEVATQSKVAGVDQVLTDPNAGPTEKPKDGK
jgi:hypothetical protein